MSQISILGCGWLGLPLAKTLIDVGFDIKGSTTSEEKIDLLKNAGIKPFKISLTEDRIIGDLPDFLLDSEVLIIDIPPRLRSKNHESFVEKMRLLLPYIEKSNIIKVLFVSSTSVYGDVISEMIDENSTLKPQTESGKQLAEVEKLLLENQNFETTILRFGGLIGDDRHPVFHLAGKENVENPNAPINLIHQEDCISIIVSIITKNIWNEVFNAVAPFHPTRKEYYTVKANESGLQLPQFKSDDQISGKIISSGKIQSVLDFKFKRGNL